VIEVSFLKRVDLRVVTNANKDERQHWTATMFICKRLLVPYTFWPIKFIRWITSGLGKSLTFQLPAVVVDHGITIVISPLLSIMVETSIIYIPKYDR
jgi:hypothetical protein